MDEKELVVVVTPLERKHTHDNKVFACRIRALGLTAYADTQEQADAKVKRMFATWVGLHRKSGTLESCLKRSKLSWWHGDEYDGTASYELILAEGGVRLVQPRKKPPEHIWEARREEMVVAH